MVELVRNTKPGAREVTHKVSRVLLQWLRNPRVWMGLGREVLLELDRTSGAEVHVGLNYETAALELGAGFGKSG